MTINQKLNAAKIAHTIIWLFYNVVIFYFVYAAIVNKIDKWIWICAGLIVLEGLILLAFNNTCPITIIARKYTNSTKDNFDIYLPEWLVRNNKRIYITIVIIASTILFFRLTG